MKEYRIPYKKEEWGEIIIHANNKKEAEKKLEESDIIEETGNKANYEFGEFKVGILLRRI